MTVINVECDNIYSGWEVPLSEIEDKSKKIFDFLISQKAISEKHFLNDYQYDSVFFDILFCDGAKTHEINRDYRNKDYPADIITFAVFADSDEDERIIVDGILNLGEIIIALDKIEESASEKRISREVELAFFIAHGLMHLLGFDHQTEQDYNFVIEYQKKALESINIKYDKV